MQTLFLDRDHAGRRLADELLGYRGKGVLVLALPEGGVAVGAALAARLGAELDVVLVRPIEAPWDDSVPVGVVDEDGHVHSTRPDLFGIGARHLADETPWIVQALRRRRFRLTGSAGPVPLVGRTVVVADDGATAPAALLGALRAVRSRHPMRLVAAIPMAAADALGRVELVADEVACIAFPETLPPPEHWYIHFEPLSEEDCARRLRSYRPPCRPTTCTVLA